MEGELERLRSTLVQLQQENKDFSKYTSHLSEACTHIEEANEKLFKSFQERYGVLRKLTDKRDNLNTDIWTTMKEVHQLGITQGQLSQLAEPLAPMIIDDAVTPIIRYAKQSLQTLAVQYFVAHGNFESFAQLQERETALTAQNKALQSEFMELWAQFNARHRVTDIRIKFDRLRKKAHLYLKQLKHKRRLEDLHRASEGKVVMRPQKLLRVLEMEPSDADSFGDLSSLLGSEFSQMDVLDDFAWHPYLHRGFVTDDNIFTRKEAYLKAESEGIAPTEGNVLRLKQELRELRKHVHKLQHMKRRGEKAKQLKKKTFVIEQGLEEVSQEPIPKEWTETDSITDISVDIDELSSAVDSGYSKTREMLVLTNEKRKLLAAKEQKETELQIVEVNNSRSESTLRTLMRSLRLLAPDEYEATLGLSSSGTMSPGLTAKRARYALRNQRAEVKVGDAESRLAEIQSDVEDMKTRIRLLKRERNLLLHPELNAKNQLSTFSQSMTKGTERVRDYFHKAAIMAIECDYLDKVKDQMCAKMSEPRISRLNAEIQEMEERIKAMKSKFDQISVAKRASSLTYPREIELLEKKASESEKSVEDMEQRVCDSVDEITQYVSKMHELGLRVPEVPRKCATLITMLHCL